MSFGDGGDVIDTTEAVSPPDETGVQIDGQNEQRKSCPDRRMEGGRGMQACDKLGGVRKKKPVNTQVDRK